MKSKWEEKKIKGNEEFHKKNFLGAIGLYTEAIKLDPTQDTLYNNRGLSYMNLNKIEPAKNDYKKAIELNPKNMKALKRLSMLNIQLGELTEAEIYLRRCVDIEPNEKSHKDELNELTDLILKQKELSKEKNRENWDKCLELSNILINKCNLNFDIKEAFFESSVKTYKLEQALNFYKTGFTIEEKKKENIQYILSILYFNEGKYDKSKQILIKLNPNDLRYKSLEDKLVQIETKKNQANDLFKKNNFTGAITLYNDLLKLDNNNKIFNSLIYANLCLCYYKIKDYFTALKNCNLSIDLNSNYWKAFYRRALVEIALKKPEEAKNDLKKVIELDPTNRDAIILLDDIEKQGNVKNYYKVLELDKNTCTMDDIKKNYKKLAAKWHPDKNNESEEQKNYAEKMFLEVTEAYNVLSNERQKEIYDKSSDISGDNKTTKDKSANKWYNSNFNSNNSYSNSYKNTANSKERDTGNNKEYTHHNHYHERERSRDYK